MLYPHDSTGMKRCEARLEMKAGRGAGKKKTPIF